MKRGEVWEAHPELRSGRVPEGAVGLTLDSVALGHQVTTPDRAKLVRRHGELTEEDLRLPDAGVLIARGIELDRR